MDRGTQSWHRLDALPMSETALPGVEIPLADPLRVSRVGAEEGR